jgi:hypothetical protein
MLYELALQTLANVNSDIALSFKQNFPEQEQLTKTKLAPALLPITASVLTVGQTTLTTQNLVQAITETYREQHWRQPYQVADIGLDFFNNAAWFPIADVGGPLVYNKGLMEIMILGANVNYPSHKHSPEELYVVLAGEVWWESSDETACWKYAGEVIHHMPNVIHSIKAGNEAVLILNVWRGGSFEMPVVSATDL